ncbi:MAG: SDR family oxidoreductase [FCB group bacterium]|jgi:NAD(P)-dependent dehydrogenase (short-subunit alcohol dehydrogenase family)
MDMSNKLCLITGATSGIGKETAFALAGMNAKIVFTARNLEKGNKTLSEILEYTKNKNVEMMECNLDSFNSIRKFCDKFKDKYNKLDILINNAGIWESKRKLSQDGIELNFAVNHLGPFLLTNLLLNLIKSSAPSRIVNVASGAHFGRVINFDDIEGKKSYSAMNAYGQSKLANILFTKKLALLLKNTDVTVNCLHPGVILTGLFKDMNGALKFFMNFGTKTAKEGAETTIYLASSDEVNSITGEYFEKRKITKSSNESCDMRVANKLWDLSGKYVSI